MAVERLKISCFNSLDDAKKNSGVSGSITVAANPEKVDLTISVETKNNVDTGEYKGDVSFSLTLDGTGVLYESEKTVAEQVDFLKKVTIAYHKDTKTSSYVRLEWGTVFSGIGAGEASSSNDNHYIGKVTKLAVHYTLFSPEGKPLRASVDLSVDQLVDLGASASFTQNLDFSKKVDENAVKDFKDAFKAKLKTAYEKMKEGKAGLR